MKQETLFTIRHSNLSARIMHGLLQEAGLDADGFLCQANLSPSQIADVRGEISGRQELDLQRAFAKATAHIEGFWFQTGLRYRLMSYGPLGLAVLSAPNVLAGFRIVVNYQALTYSLMNYRLRIEQGRLISLDADDRDVPADLCEFMHERALGSVIRFIADMTPDEPLVRVVHSVLDRPDGWQQCDELIGTHVEFNAPETRWIFHDNISELDLPMSSPVLEQTYEQLCDSLIEQADIQDPFASSVYDLLVRTSRRYPTASETALRLAISERTLQRRLQKCGKSYRAILDDVRYQRARFLLETTNIPIGLIGDMLGFSEPANFTRSFKRWTHMSPQSYRQLPRGQG
jgi:AraC-like DNA-binding protein